jgi:hypothetical protein
VIDIQLRHVIAGSALAGLMLGSGAAVAWAQTDSSSSSGPTTTQPGSSGSEAPAPGTNPAPHHQGGSSANCPNMGNDSGSNAPSSYPGV